MKIKVYSEIFLTCLYASHIVADHRSICVPRTEVLRKTKG